MRISKELADIREELARSTGRMEAALDALAENRELHETLRLRAWARLRQNKIKGTPDNPTCPPGFPPGTNLEDELDLVLGPLRAKIKAGGGQPAELGNPYLKKFRERVGL